MPPNVSKILIRWGLGEELAERALKLETMHFNKCMFLSLPSFPSFGLFQPFPSPHISIYRSPSQLHPNPSFLIP